jgi:hypothetical protein
MRDETLVDREEASTFLEKWIAMTPGEPPAQQKWSRRRRFGFILVSSLFFWVILLFAIRLI